MAGFTIDMEGRVRNFNLPKQKPLIPLYEAVVNSIYAIEDRSEREEFDGYIKIEVIREPQQYLGIDGVDNSVNEITGFNIIDNGIGLDERNMQSFLESDSTYRAEKGGKGVGRFSWLKAFEKAEVESIFKDDANFVKRQFIFSLSQKEIDDKLTVCENEHDNRTTIKLVNYKPEYRRNVKKHGCIIANRIMQHCMIYLISASCPHISIIDEDMIYDINQMFNEKVRKAENSVEIHVGQEVFSLLHIKLEDSSIKGNKLYLCANERVVREEELDRKIVDLDKKIYLEEGYYYVGVLTGDYFDKNVDMTRTSFAIAEKSGEDDISIEDIINASKVEIEIFLKEYLSRVRNEKNAQIRKYITSQAPQFMHLLKFMPDDIANIKPGLSNEKLDEELYKIKRKFELTLKAESTKMLKQIEEGKIAADEYEDKFQEQFEKISEANKSALAEYVAHRKVILDLLKLGIRIKDDGRFNKEAYIHNLIFPMHKTSEEIEYAAHNLWLIDERLAYCDYISSDIPFNNDRHEERADILFLDKPVAVSDEDNSGKEYESIVIFELKRPMRNDYSMSDNPIEQMLRYVDKLSKNNVTDKEGRYIKVGNTTQFYLYAICDITPKLVDVAEQYDFTQTPDKCGYYRYHEKKKAYIEILSYDKIINDAEKRNRILFDKLGIL